MNIKDRGSKRGSIWFSQKKNRWKSAVFKSIRGAGGSRTLVQTRKPYAFYMLIFAWIFVYRQDRSHQSIPYPLKFRERCEESLKLFPNLLCHFTKRFGTRAFEWHLVSTTMAEIKLIYYTSIKQRERNEFRQIKFWRLRFKCKSTTHCMLTYHFCPLSNPVNPMTL